MHYFMGGILNRKGVKVVVGGISVPFSNVVGGITELSTPPDFVVSLRGSLPTDG